MGAIFVMAAATFAQSVAVGTWANESQAAGGGPDAVTLVIKADGTGMFIGGGVENPLSEIKMNGDSISFTFHPEGTPPAIRMTMLGTVEGDMLTIDTTISGANGATSYAPSWCKTFPRERAAGDLRRLCRFVVQHPERASAILTKIEDLYPSEYASILD